MSQPVSFLTSDASRADASRPLSPVEPSFPMMSITFRDVDLVTVLHLNAAELSVVRQAIKDTWQLGIQVDLSRCGTGWSFKLNGYPFSSTSSKPSQQSREMVMQILKNLHGIGYQVLASGTLGRQVDRSTLFFKKSSSNVAVPQFLCVSFNDYDKIQFTNLPSHLADAIKDTIRKSWSFGIQSVDNKNGVLQFKLAGNPWSASNDKQSIKSKMLLQAIFAALHQYQWVYHVNVNLNRNSDCLIFRHDVEVDNIDVPQFCMISFGEGDLLRLINASTDIINTIRTVVKANWNEGQIQDETDFHGSRQFKISGFPWSSRRRESARARYLILKIFEEMLRHGWHNVAGFYLNRRSSDRVVLLFQKREPVTCPLFCIAPRDNDKFLLINMPEELVSLFKNIFQSRWSNGIQAEKSTPLPFGIGSVYKLTLSDKPWLGDESTAAIYARSFLCSVIEEFSKLGWQIMLCADVTSKIENNCPLDVYSFWFAYRAVAAPPPSAPPLPGYYGVGWGVFPPPGSLQYSGFGMAGAPAPAFNEPPPTYSEATGWD